MFYGNHECGKRCVSALFAGYGNAGPLQLIFPVSTAR